MPVYALGREPRFPDPEQSDPSGLLAVGGDLSPERLLAAYAAGIFPWYSEGEPILWHSPDPRIVLPRGALHVSRSLERTLRRGRFRLTLDADFDAVIRACAEVPRREGEGTWITRAMRRAYGRLHGLGFAHSCEAWQDERLVGGLYGVSLGSAFFGESMFHLVSDASKAAFVALVRQLEAWNFDFIDCQVHTRHLERFGAVPWPRRDFLQALAHALEGPTRRGPWRFDAALPC